MTAGAQELIEGLLQSIGMHRGALADDVAHVTVHHNRVLGAHMVPGFHVDAEELDDGIRAHVVVGEGARIAKPVHLCFGMLPETGLQRILLNIEVLGDSRVSVIAHCTFPNAVDVRHEMDAEIVVGPHANYSYFERHVHGEKGGVVVVPKARVRVREGGRFKRRRGGGTCGRASGGAPTTASTSARRPSLRAPTRAAS
ncbi:MAG: hypothetical protein NTW86_23480 [Candidatus Sumerlaeota bacterium]|nr:hypothetical protein [Candidatus Sumerlaeota bacterium]